MNDTKYKWFRGGKSEAFRGVLVRTFNQEIDALHERLTAAGMPEVGFCACLASHYAYLARETGGSEKQAIDVATECVRRVFSDQERPS